MTYQPRNRRIDLTLAFTVANVPFYVDDVDHDGTPNTWGREGSSVKVCRTYGKSRFTLCDDRGRFLKNERPYLGEYKRRVRTFNCPQAAALFAVDASVEDCA